MRSGLIIAALVGIAAAVPQAVAPTIPPPSQPTGCSPTFDNGNNFQIGIVDASNSSATKSKLKRSPAVPDGVDPNTMPGNTLMLTLNNGVLLDQDGRYGYIASNDQLQFDNPIQSGATITTGFSACGNGTLALETAIWWQCLSGSFYNLYDNWQGDQCEPCFLQIIPEAREDLESSTLPVTTSPASSTSTVAATPSSADSLLTSLSEGQVQLPTFGGVSSPSSTVVSSTASVTAITTLSASSLLSASAAVSTRPSSVVPIVTQIIDGQIQAPTNASTTLTPFNPNAAPAVGFSGTFLAVAVGAVGLGAILL